MPIYGSIQGSAPKTFPKTVHPLTSRFNSTRSEMQKEKTNAQVLVGWAEDQAEIGLYPAFTVVNLSYILPLWLVHADNKTFMFAIKAILKKKQKPPWGLIRITTKKQNEVTWWSNWLDCFSVRVGVIS